MAHTQTIYFNILRKNTLAKIIKLAILFDMPSDTKRLLQNKEHKR